MNMEPFTVALADPLWIGHHPMYFTQFAASFLRNGARVICLCPEPDAAHREFAGAWKTGNPWETGHTEEISGRIHFRHLAAGARSFFNGRFEGDPLRTFQRWRTVAARLAEAEAATGWHTDLVYFPYLDSYLRFLPFPIIPDLLLGRRWSGLYFRNHHFAGPASLRKTVRDFLKGDALVRSELCAGIGTLDERFIPEMERACGKNVVPFPDFTHTGLPPEPSALARNIKARAGDRKIIGMIGLERRKGVLTMIRTARLAAEKNVPAFFVCAGAIHLGEFTNEERMEISAAADAANVYLDVSAGRLPTEVEFNSLFSHFDIAWAAYENFHGSSNTLGKAAAFRIPCIATADECIGNRVRTYRIGKTLAAPTPENALAAISALIAAPLADPGFPAYERDHSLKRLDELLGGLIDRRPPAEIPAENPHVASIPA